MIKTLILDWAGTLVDDIDMTLAATNATLEHFGGKPVDLATYRRDFVIPVDAFYNAHLPKPRTLAEVDDVFFARYGAEIDRLRLFPNVRALLSIAKARGLGVFVLSTVPSAVILDALRRFQLDDTVTEVIGGAFDKRRFLPGLIERRGLVRDQTLFVGDSLHDIETARESGTRSGAALWGYSPADRLRAAGADYEFSDVASMLHQLDRDWMTQTIRYVISTVGGFILDDRDRMVLVRTRKWSNTFGIPGGKIQYGETMSAAFEREIREETGLAIHDVRFLMIQDCIESKEFVEPRHFLLINYVARTHTPERLTKNYEIEECRWATVAEARELPLNIPTRIALDEALRLGLIRNDNA